MTEVEYVSGVGSSLYLGGNDFTGTMTDQMSVLQQLQYVLLCPDWAGGGVEIAKAVKGLGRVRTVPTVVSPEPSPYTPTQ